MLKRNITTVNQVVQVPLLRRSVLMIPVHMITWIIALVGLIGGLLLYCFLGILVFAVGQQAIGGFAELRSLLLPQEAVMIPWITATGFYCLTALLLVLFSLTGADKLRMHHIRLQQYLLFTQKCADTFQFLAASIMLRMPQVQRKSSAKSQRAVEQIARRLGEWVGRVVGTVWGWVASLLYGLHHARWHTTVTVGLLFVAVDLGGFYSVAAVMRHVLYERFHPGAPLNALTDVLNYLQSVPGGIFYVGRQSLYYLLIWLLMNEKFVQLRSDFREQIDTQLTSGLLRGFPGWFFRWWFPALIWTAFAFHMLSGLLILSGVGATPGDSWSSFLAFMVAWRPIFVGPMFAWLTSVIQYRILVGRLSNRWEHCQRIACWAVFWGTLSQLVSGPMGYMVRVHLMDQALPPFQLEAGYLWAREGLGNIGGILASVVTLMILASLKREKHRHVIEHASQEGAR